MRTLHISAGGLNTRLKDFLFEEFQAIPKHILPLPGQSLTLIEAVVNNASVHFDQIVIEANNQNIFIISPLFSQTPKVNPVIDRISSGPLGPVIRHLQEKKERSYGCAGDYYCNFSWADFETFHDSHEYPVSILVSRSTPAPKGARFHVNCPRINSWERVDCTRESDLINIGVYIIDPDEKVLEILKQMNWHKEDVFFDLLIEKGLLAAYNPGGLGYNINTPVVYKSLCEALNKGLK